MDVGIQVAALYGIGLLRCAIDFSIGAFRRSAAKPLVTHGRIRRYRLARCKHLPDARGAVDCFYALQWMLFRTGEDHGDYAGVGIVGDRVRAVDQEEILRHAVHRVTGKRRDLHPGGVNRSSLESSHQRLIIRIPIPLNRSGIIRFWHDLDGGGNAGGGEGAVGGNIPGGNSFGFDRPAYGTGHRAGVRIVTGCLQTDIAADVLDCQDVIVQGRARNVLVGAAKGAAALPLIMDCGSVRRDGTRVKRLPVLGDALNGRDRSDRDG